MVVVVVTIPWIEAEAVVPWEAVVVAWTEVAEAEVGEVEVRKEEREVLETAWAVAVEVEAGDPGHVRARSEADDSWRKEVDATTAHA